MSISFKEKYGISNVIDRPIATNDSGEYVTSRSRLLQKELPYISDAIKDPVVYAWYNVWIRTDLTLEEGLKYLSYILLHTKRDIQEEFENYIMRN